MRVRGLGDADLAEQLDRARARLGLGDVAVRLDRLDDLPADLVEGVQRGERVLEDHRDLVAAHRPQPLVVELEQVAAAEADRAVDRRVRRPASARAAVRLATLFPEPDSPTIPSVRPGSTE